MTWTPERIAELEDAVIAKLSGSEAARLLGVTRGAAIGKAWRLGLSFQSQPKPDVWRVYERGGTHG